MNHLHSEGALAEFAHGTQRMRIAVTGSTGLIGSMLCRILAEAGHDIIHLVRDARNTTTYDRCHWIPTAGIQQLDKCQQLDAVVNLAGRSIGQSRWSVREKRLLRESRVAATSILASQLASLAQPPHTFVSASAIGIYGNRGDEIVTEESETGQDFLAQLASQWEQACLPLSNIGARVVHARLGIVLSPAGGALKKLYPIFRFGLGGPLGSGKQFWSWVSLNDVVRAMNFLLVNPDCVGPFNISAPKPVTNGEFTRKLASAMHRPAAIRVPAPVLRMALGEMADGMLLSSCRALPQRLVNQGFQFTHPTLVECLTRIMSEK